MLAAALTFADGNRIPLAIGLLGVLAGVLWWSYRRTDAAEVRWGGRILKWLGLTALILCLLEPRWLDQRARPGANLFAVVADNSQGLQIHDPGASLSRGQYLRELLNPDVSPWLPEIEKHFELRRYLFDVRLQNVRDFGLLNFEGPASGILGALRTVADRHQGRPLAGVLLLTDGNATDLPETMPDLAGLPPVYPVVLGGREAPRDLSLQSVTVNPTSFEDAPVSLQAVVQAGGFRGRDVVANLRDLAGQSLGRQVLRVPADESPIHFRFQFRPAKPGLSFCELEVALAASGTGSVRSNAAPEEATLANNRRVAVVDRGQGPYRVLYVSGRPNWEYKFLNRAVQGDDQIQMVGLIRVAKREPKLEFRGRAGETSNPLFRGFGEQSREEVERYDQPVLVRLNTRDELELRAGFPRVPEDLYGYHAVIVDDLEAGFFGADQALLLQRFVSERGGGFLMLGGMESMAAGQYHRTAIGDLLPVYLDRIPDRPPPGPVRWNLSREGWLQPWARLREGEADEKSRLENMPPFEVLNPVGGLKPGASVVATAINASGHEVPALAIQRFGRGRSGVLTIGDFWRWGMRDPAAREDMEKAWRQLVRWLVTDVPRRVELVANTSHVASGEGVTLQVRVRDPRFQPLDDAGVQLVIQPVFFSNGPPSLMTNVVRLVAEPSAAEPGLYEAVFVPHLTGGFLATALVTNSVGAEVGRAEAGWSSDLAAEEFRSLTPNRSLLENIARLTGGEVLEPAQLGNFARKIPGRPAPIMEATTSPAWHTPWWFTFAVGCFLLEWGLRRLRGLP